jgi:hypothetical protein
MAGFGPMKLASRASEKIASTTSVPALNVVGSSSTLSPSASANTPFSTPMIAGAWVTFGK